MGFHGFLLLICVCLVFALGLVMVFDTSSAEVLNLSLETSTHQALIKQLIYALLGAGAALIVWLVGYKNILKMSFPLFCLVSFLLILTFVPGLGQMRNGARRWIGFLGYTIQPSELAKLVVPLYYIYYIARHPSIKTHYLSFIKFMAFCCIPIVLVMLEPDNGTTGIIVVTMIVLFFLTRVRWAYWVWPIAGIFLLGIILASQLSYVSGRLDVYLNPESDLLGRGHQPYQAKIAAGSGELFGKGVGQSLQKLNYLPEAQNDYIAAIFAEEFGFIGILILLFLYMLIAYFGFYIASKAKDQQGAQLAATLTFLISFQVFLNLGVVSGLLPSTGLNLPFFSQGGTSLMANIVAIGLLLRIAYESKCQAV